MAHEFERPLLYFSPRDPWTLRDALEGTIHYGMSGSGKTSGAGKAIFQSFCRAGMGGLVLCTKPDDAAMYTRQAKEVGRDVVVFSPDNPYRFNFLEYEAKRKQTGAGLTHNIVNLLNTVNDCLERGESREGEKFWKNAFVQISSSAVDTVCLAGETLSVNTLHEVVTSAPVNHEQVDSESWQQSSLCYRLLNRALNNENLSPRQKADLRIAGKYFLNEFPQMPGDTRGSIVSTFSTTTNGLMRGIVGELLSTGLNIVPEITHHGAILIVDLNVKTFGEAGRAATVIWKLLWQQALERRSGGSACFLWSDECQNYLHKGDIDFQLTARSGVCATVYLTQNLNNFLWAFGEKGEAMTHSLMGVLGTKIFGANSDIKTNQMAADYFGKQFQQRFNSGINNNEGRQGTTAGSAENLDYTLQPVEFTCLRKGGPSNGLLVETIIGQGGRRFSNGQTFIRTMFKQ